MAIDIKACIGCHTCSVVCKSTNNLPNDIWYNRILTIGGESQDTAAGVYGNNSLQYLPVNCQHCENPACVKACPVGATYKRKEDGIVIQDPDKCIGCRYCMVACPYSGVRQFNWEEPKYYVDFSVGDANAKQNQFNTVSKCDFCADRLAEGKEPACVELCPGRARYFGDIDDPESDVSKAIKGRDYFHLMGEKGTKPSIYYLK